MVFGMETAIIAVALATAAFRSRVVRWQCCKRKQASNSLYCPCQA
jgi:hypothetical protein